MYNYGRCHVCGSAMEARRIKQDFWVRGRLLVVDGVPAGVCSQCGEKVVNAEVGRSIAALIGQEGPRRPRTTMRVPVIKFAASPV